MASIVYKYELFNKRDNEKRQSLTKYERDSDGKKYISFSTIILTFLLQKESNHILDLSKETKSLNHLICIPKDC